MTPSVFSFLRALNLIYIRTIIRQKKACVLRYFNHIKNAFTLVPSIILKLRVIYCILNKDCYNTTNDVKLLITIAIEIECRKRNLLNFIEY